MDAGRPPHCTPLPTRAARADAQPSRRRCAPSTALADTKGARRGSAPGSPGPRPLGARARVRVRVPAGDARGEGSGEPGRGVPGPKGRTHPAAAAWAPGGRRACPCAAAARSRRWSSGLPWPPRSGSTPWWTPESFFRSASLQPRRRPAHTRAHTPSALAPPRQRRPRSPAARARVRDELRGAAVKEAAGPAAQAGRERAGPGAWDARGKAAAPRRAHTPPSRRARGPPGAAADAAQGCAPSGPSSSTEAAPQRATADGSARPARPLLAAAAAAAWLGSGRPRPARAHSARSQTGQPAAARSPPPPPPPPDAHPARLPGAPRLLSARPPPRHTHTFSPFSELEHRSGRGRRRREEEEEDGRRGRAQRKGRDRGPSWTARALLAPPPTARPARRPPPSVRAPARRSRPLERVRQADTDLRLPLGCRGVVGENMAASACPLAAGAAGALPGAHALRSGPLCSRAALSYF
jgi:hypothetical protein